MAHQIRLRGPWEWELVADDTTSGERLEEEMPGGKIQMPADWGAAVGTSFRGKVRFSRFFHAPTGIEEQSVYLIVEQVDCYAEIFLNDRCLGQQDGKSIGRYEITSHLQQRNQLLIDVELPPDKGNLPRPPGRIGLPGGITGEVRLEIE